jgi:hypothetical protein
MRAILYEDRSSDVVAVKILVSSIVRHSPTVDIDVTLPCASAADQRWFARQPRVQLRTTKDDLHCTKYDVKPSVLKRGLAEGADPSVWIDSDIVVVGDFRPLFDGVSPSALSVSEEPLGVPHQGGTSRTTNAGFTVGRPMRVTANSCVTRVTKEHLPLLEAWEQRLRQPDYLAAQALPLPERPHWFVGDQDILTALLGSDRFAQVPIHWLKRGRDVAHCFQGGGIGYNVLERAVNAATRHVPTFAHSCGDRPWRPPDGKQTLHLETSPYTLAAATYEREVEEPLPWTRPSLPAARALRLLFADGLNMSGFLPALSRELLDQRILKALVRPILKPGS